MMPEVRGPLFGVAAQCEPILRALPDWFGVDSAVQAYRQNIDTLPTFVAGPDEQLAGFLTVKRHNDYAAELYVMAVRYDLHRQGVGRTLVAAAERWLAATGVEYAYVKTLGPSLGYEPFERTRLFYVAVGYRPLEEFKCFWANDPCLVLVKKLTPEPSS